MAASAAEDFRTYELVGLVPGSLNDKDAQKVVADVKKLVAKAKGEITVEDLWARRPLAYPIKHEDQASYLILDFTAEGSALKGLEKTLRLESKLIRFGVFAMPEAYRYVSIATLQAQAAEAKEALAPGLDAPKRRPSRIATPKIAKSAPSEPAAPAETAPSKNLDEALKKLDESL